MSNEDIERLRASEREAVARASAAAVECQVARADLASVAADLREAQEEVERLHAARAEMARGLSALTERCERAEFARDALVASVREYEAAEAATQPAMDAISQLVAFRACESKIHAAAEASVRAINRVKVARQALRALVEAS